MGSLIMRSRTMVFLCSTVLALAPAAAQERMYKCVDARGKVYYTQVPPPECLGRDTQELNKSGTLIRKNPAAIPLTPAQEQAREAERRKKLEDEEKSREERRKNLALLNTYSSERDIEEARARGSPDCHRGHRKANRRGPEAPQGAGGGKRVLREETDALQAQAGNREQRYRDPEPDRPARREKEGDQHDQRQVRHRQAPLRRADEREGRRPEAVDSSG